MKHKGNNYAFIDGQNLHITTVNMGWEIDYNRFRTYLRDKFDVVKAFYFIGFIPTNAVLYESLQEDGYILIFKPTLKLPSGKHKGNIDAELVLHAMIQYQNYDKAVIVSGDGDFYCLANYLLKNNKLLKLIVPNDKRYSSLFRKFKEYVMGVNRLRGKLEK